jgi:2-polyprenyl-6-methoxyphenol hydroxylase-like FAD-dependent oxidoreductase
MSSVDEALADDIEEVDVVIVGARIAGTATAVPLARKGLRVVVLDKVHFPSDTISTHAMVPSGVQELSLMGALDRVLALKPAMPRYLAVHDGDISFRERYREHLGIDYGLCIPRDQLDVLLVQTAREAGVDVRERCGVENEDDTGAAGVDRMLVAPRTHRRVSGAERLLRGPRIQAAAIARNGSVREQIGDITQHALTLLGDPIEVRRTLHPMFRSPRARL